MTLIARAGLAVACMALGVGCVDTPRAAGGLQLGVDDGPLRPPTRLDAGKPFEFPAGAWQDGVGGTTVVKLLISREGIVDSAMVLESSGHPSLDSAALSQASALEFEPAAQGGEPVQVWGRLPVIFPLADEMESDADTP